MPLPANWKGAFWGPESNGHLLVDPAPEDLTALLAEYPDDPIYLIGGGIFDLRLNGMEERANLILAAARRQWPTANWNAIDELLNLAAMKCLDMSPDLLRANGRNLDELMQRASAAYGPATPAQ